jgi:hypothetical protein
VGDGCHQIVECTWKLLKLDPQSACFHGRGKLSLLYSNASVYTNSHLTRTQNFSLGWGGGEGGADPEAAHNLCLILKIML